MKVRHADSHTAMWIKLDERHSEFYIAECVCCQHVLKLVVKHGFNEITIYNSSYLAQNIENWTKYAGNSKNYKN